MSALSSEQIVIFTTFKSVGQKTPLMVSGRVPILETILPHLSLEQAHKLKPKQRLKKVDSYMLEESALLLTKVAQVCSNINFSVEDSFKVDIENGLLLVSGSCASRKQLAKAMNQDNWISDCFAWLHPNYIGLAHSQELVSFSHAYAKNKQQARLQFEHFQQPNQGMKCYLSGQVRHGKLELIWRIESPLVSYNLE